VYGGYYRDFRFMSGVSAHDIRPVTMCVDDVYGPRATDPADERPLAQISAPRHDERHQVYVRVLERGGKVPAVARTGERWSDDDGVPCTPLRCREGGDDGLEPPNRSGSEQVQYRKWRGQCDWDAEVVWLVEQCECRVRARNLARNVLRPSAWLMRDGAPYNDVTVRKASPALRRLFC
jgi:hypothetical protein